MASLAYTLLGAVIGCTLAFFFIRSPRFGRRLIENAQVEVEHTLKAARLHAEKLKLTAALEAKQELLRSRDAWEEELQKRRAEFGRAENRLDSRELQIERQLTNLDQRKTLLDARDSQIDSRQKELDKAQGHYRDLLADQRQKLEYIVGMSADEAKCELMQGIEAETRTEAAQLIRNIKEEATQNAVREARHTIATAIERIAADQTTEMTGSVVLLPNDEIKGRIIGREGRNIRAFENLTGVNVIIDDTPEVVVLSTFDPRRREIARVAMTKLVADGRIYPGRIEAFVEQAEQEVETGMQQAAEETCFELDIPILHPRLMDALGRLKYRTSYGQNQLQHTLEVAKLAGYMAGELGLDIHLAKRMGLLHDIGKGLTHEHEGSHVELGYELCRRCQEPDQVLNAIRAHHDEEPARYPETFVVTAADTISAARPGARRESLEAYVKRLEKLEAIAATFEGVNKCFAVQAGREIHIMVSPEAVTDEELTPLSERVAQRLEQELHYPGRIKVVVMRERRAVTFAQ